MCAKVLSRRRASYLSIIDVLLSFCALAQAQFGKSGEVLSSSFTVNSSNYLQQRILETPPVPEGITENFAKTAASLNGAEAAGDDKDEVGGGVSTAAAGNDTFEIAEASRMERPDVNLINSISTPATSEAGSSGLQTNASVAKLSHHKAFSRRTCRKGWAHVGQACYKVRTLDNIYVEDLQLDVLHLFALREIYEKVIALRKKSLVTKKFPFFFTTKRSDFSLYIFLQITELTCDTYVP